jgi:hypothetical protein
MNTDEFRTLIAAVAKEDAERAAAAVLSRANRLSAEGYLSNTSLITLHQFLKLMGLCAVAMLIILFNRPDAVFAIIVASIFVTMILVTLCLGTEF